ncbi:chemotaxis protein CheW [bacterium]|nr:chemotaxis protein CheW [bacterium]
MAVSRDIVVLLVEDAGVMRSMEKKTLQSIGFSNIIEAKDGNEAIDKLKKEKDIELVISDWNMPNMNGYELLQWVRSKPNFKDVPFIMATGRGEKKEVEKASNAGVSSFIAKPFNAEELSKKIEEAFSGPSEGNKKGTWEPKISESGKVIFRVAHIQITDHLVLGVLKHMIDSGKVSPEYFELETVCMESWNPVSSGLESGSVDGACVLAPIAMDLFGYGVPIKLVLLAHKNGSIFVRNNKGGDYQKPYQDFFRNKFFYIPHMLSIHHMLAHMFFDNIGLNASFTGGEGTDVNFEVVPPIKMPNLLAENPDACGYLVAEPLGTKAIASGDASLQFFSKELWEDHPCCVVTLRDEIIDQYSDAVYEFSKYLVEAGKFISEKPGLAAEIGVSFLDPDGSLGIKPQLVKNVLTEPLGITTDDLYPVKEDLERVQHYMHDQMNIGKIIDLDEFVDLRFADAACGVNGSAAKKTTGYSAGERAMDILSSRVDEGEDIIAEDRRIEGKYLTFDLGDQQFGIDIMSIREIIQFAPMRSVPKSDPILTGIMNLRGRVIPVIDLRLAMGLEHRDCDRKCRIIVLEFESLEGSVQIGVVVDKVIAVIDVMKNNIDDAPGFRTNMNTEFILAFAKIKDDILILLDIEKIMTQKQHDEVETVYNNENV